MQVNQAIIAFSQSEKLKSGIIWASQIIEMYIALSESEKPGAERVLKTLINMIAAEISTMIDPSNSQRLRLPLSPPRKGVITLLKNLDITVSC